MIHAIKFHSTMTDNSFYVCGDLDTLENNEWEIKTAFFNMIRSDEYNEREMFSNYFGLIESLELIEINDMYDAINESEIDIISEYNSRF